tara:strand:+ start:6607 stop:6882 length:276 start_codon:yes stop_codon:yes gene_type:complete
MRVVSVHLDKLVNVVLRRVFVSLVFRDVLREPTGAGSGPLSVKALSIPPPKSVTVRTTTVMVSSMKAFDASVQTLVVKAVKLVLVASGRRV